MRRGTSSPPAPSPSPRGACQPCGCQSVYTADTRPPLQLDGEPLLVEGPIGEVPRCAHTPGRRRTAFRAPRVPPAPALRAEMPPSERPGTSTPAFGRAAAAVAATPSAATEMATGSASYDRQYAALGFARRAAVRRRLLGRAARASSPSGSTRVTTTVVLHGDGETGEGEDVTYTAPDHDHFPGRAMLAGTWTLDDSLGAARRVRGAGREALTAAGRSRAPRSISRCGRRGSLADALGREYRPVRFVASTRADIERVPRARTRARVQARRRGGLGPRR